MILNLYANELKKTKKSFILMAAFSLLMLVIMYLTLRNEFGLAMKNLTALKESSDEAVRWSVNNFKEFSPGYSYVSMSMIFTCLIGLASVLLSIQNISLSYRKKHQSRYIEAGLPVSLVSQKVAKIASAYTLYLFSILIFTIGILVINKMFSIKTGGMFEGNYMLSSVEFIPLLPISLKNLLMYSGILILTCIISTQSLVSALYVEGGVVKKIVCFLLIAIGALGVGLYIVVYINTFQRVMNHRYLNWDPIINTGLILLAAILFIIDIRATKKRERGGL